MLTKQESKFDLVLKLNDDPWAFPQPFTHLQLLCWSLVQENHHNIFSFASQEAVQEWKLHWWFLANNKNERQRWFLPWHMAASINWIWRKPTQAWGNMQQILRGKWWQSNIKQVKQTQSHLNVCRHHFWLQEEVWVRTVTWQTTLLNSVMVASHNVHSNIEKWNIHQLCLWQHW